MGAVMHVRDGDMDYDDAAKPVNEEISKLR